MESIGEMHIITTTTTSLSLVQIQFSCELSGGDDSWTMRREGIWDWEKTERQCEK